MLTPLLYHHLPLPCNKCPAPKVVALRACHTPFLLRHTASPHTCDPREEELPELEVLVRSGAAPVKAQGGVESKQGKANVLIQVHTVFE